MLKMKADVHTEFSAKVVLDLRLQFTMLNSLRLTCIHVWVTRVWVVVVNVENEGRCPYGITCYGCA